jgi:cupin superfamily acireductone dioxygenase involved in methionine salvage
MPVNQTPRPIDICSQQIKDLQNEIKILKCDVINLKEQLRQKEEKFQIINKRHSKASETEIATKNGWLW